MCHKHVCIADPVLGPVLVNFRRSYSCVFPVNGQALDNRNGCNVSEHFSWSEPNSLQSSESGEWVKHRVYSDSRMLLRKQQGQRGWISKTWSERSQTQEYTLRGSIIWSSRSGWPLFYVESGHAGGRGYPGWWKCSTYPGLGGRPTGVCPWGNVPALDMEGLCVSLHITETSVSLGRKEVNKWHPKAE